MPRQPRAYSDKVYEPRGEIGARADRQKGTLQIKVQIHSRDSSSRPTSARRWTSSASNLRAATDETQHGLHLAYCTNIHRGEDWAKPSPRSRRTLSPFGGASAQNKPYASGCA